MSDALAQLVDQRAIEAVYVLYCELVDAKDFDRLDEVFAADTRGDYTQALGAGVVIEGLAALVAAMHANLGAGSSCGATHHNVTNFRVAVDSDRATAKVHYIAAHAGGGICRRDIHDVGRVRRPAGSHRRRLADRRSGLHAGPLRRRSGAGPRMSESETMQAMVIDRFGEPDALRAAEIERPVAGPGQVVIRAAWAGVNPADWKARRGWLSRYFEYRFPFVLGFDAAGTVSEVGEGVSEFAVGDRVVTASNQGLGERGSYAQFVRSDVDRVAKLGDQTSLDRAAALPTAGITAWEALFDVGRLELGQRVLVNGGAGGTGSFAIRLAVDAGARVAATAGPGNLAYLRELGVECAIDYRAGSVGEAVRAWAGDALDLVVDTVGQGTLLDAVEWVRPGGTIAPIGTLIPDEPQHDVARAAARGVRVVPTVASFERQGRQLRALVERLEHGLFDPIALTRMPLAEVAEAHRKIEAGHVRGKIVLEIP